MIQARTMTLILAAVAFSAMGQLFLKSGARQLTGHGGAEFLTAAIQNVEVSRSSPMAAGA